MQLPDDFRQRMISVFGEDGRIWLERLPRIVDEYVERWDLAPEREFPLSYNYVAPAKRRDGTPVVLKAGVPREQIACEIAALRHWDGNGAVRLIEADAEAGVLLLERAFPGTPLVRLDDDAEATRIAAGIMRKLQRPAPPEHSFPTLVDWAKAFPELRARHGGTSGPLHAALFERGEALFHELAASQATTVVLHGDLHHWNVIAAEREPWLAIDPHGVVGEPAFEVGAWMRNPVGDPGEPDEARFLLRQPDVRGMLDRRLDIFAGELGLDRGRLRDWCIAFCVLSASWSDEAGHTQSAAQAMAVAEHLAAL